MSKLVIEHVTKTFGPVRAVDGVSLEVAEGETVVLLGSSGCGKTTLLRLIAGFLRPDNGTIKVSGRPVAADTVMVPPEKRSLSMVFQSYAVWPHKTVAENLAYGLKLRSMDKATIKSKIEGALAMVRMEKYAARYPAELSGGQQQRVALARALVLEPEILLFDEPLSNLDATLREHMRFEIKALLNKLKITSIYVTHDQNEAMVIADRIAVMSQGHIEQLGTAEEVYYQSKTDFVAQFIGLANVLDAEIVGSEADRVKVDISGAGGILARANGERPSSGRVRLFVRPERIGLVRTAEEGKNTLRGRILRRSFLGAQTDFLVDVNGVQFRVIVPSDHGLPGVDEEVLASFSPDDCLVLANTTQ